MIRDIDGFMSGEGRFTCRRFCNGGDDNTTTNQSVSEPWKQAQPFLTDLMGRAQGLTNQGSSYAPFSTVAPFSDQTLQGLNMTQNIAGQGNPVTGAAGGAITNLLQSQTSPGSDVLRQWANPGNINPYLQGVYNSASKPVIDSVNSQFSRAGRTGSAANQNALTTQLGDLSANIFGQGYDSAANRSLNSANLLNNNALQMGNQKVAAAALAPNLDNQRYTGAQNLLSVGNAYDQQAQKYLTDAQNRWDYTQNQPWNLLNNYSNIVRGIGGMGGTSSGSTTQPSPSVLPQLLGTGVNLLSSPTSTGSSLFSNLLGF
jgi:hypothetical protein